MVVTPPAQEPTVNEVTLTSAVEHYLERWDNTRDCKWRVADLSKAISKKPTSPAHLRSRRIEGRPYVDLDELARWATDAVQRKRRPEAEQAPSATVSERINALGVGKSRS